MTKQESKDRLYFIVPTVVADVLGHLLCYFLAYQIFCKYYFGTEALALDNWVALFSLLTISYSFAVLIYRLKLAGRQISASKVILRALAQASLTILFFTILIAIVYKVVPRRIILLEWGLAMVVVTIVHLAVNYGARTLRRRGRNSTSVLFVGADRNNMHIMHYVQRDASSGYRIVGAFTSEYDENVPEGVENLGDPSSAVVYLREHPNCTDALYCSLSPNISDQQKVIDDLIYECDLQLITFYYVPNMDGYVKRRLSYDEFGGRTIIKLYDEPLANVSNQVIKRVFDVVVSGLFLCTIFPFIFLFVGIGVKLSSPGPIFFKQKRTGYNGKSFDCLKFRSMRVSADADTKQATADDPRKTKFGDFIRKTSLDEFPQFINVFVGDMSIVGPRPHMEHHTEVYSELISDYMVRHLVRPGITGWAQVSGCRGETKTTQDMKDRVEHDIWYIEHWSFSLDLEILFRTAKQILLGDKQAY